MSFEVPSDLKQQSMTNSLPDTRTYYKTVVNFVIPIRVNETMFGCITALVI